MYLYMAFSKFTFYTWFNVYGIRIFRRMSSRVCNRNETCSDEFKENYAMKRRNIHTTLYFHCDINKFLESILSRLFTSILASEASVISLEHESSVKKAEKKHIILISCDTFNMFS